MKYMGSKARFAKEILPIVLEGRKPNQWYVEPFCGGCNMIDKVDGNRLANDINPYLIEMWVDLIQGWEPPKQVSREQHKSIRENKQNYPKSLVGWVGFNCSYSGVFFSGFAGKTKTKIGTIRDYQSEAIRNVTKQLPLLENVLFTNKEYWGLSIPEKSIIYCDPPYGGVSKYKTDEFDHEMFWIWVRNMSKNGHSVFVSEYNAPDDFECVWEKEAKSSLSANGKCGGNKVSTEKLFRLKAAQTR